MEYNTRKTLEIYLAHAAKYKIWGSIILISVVSGAATNAVAPLYYKKFFDILVSGQAKEEVAGALISVLIFIAVIHMIGWISWRTAAFISASFQTNVIANLSNTCFAYLHKHSFSYFNLRIPHSSAVGYLDKESLKTIGFQHKRFPLDTSQLAAG